jgi:L-alanine-DL-glutamate epimerase-like enolase superfamily enzyme
MRIEHVETLHLYFEYPEGRSFSTPVGPVKGRTATLVRVHTDDGRVGVGSAYAHPGMVAAAIEHLTPLLVGTSLDEDARDDFAQFAQGGGRIATLWRLMYLWTRWSGRKGAAMVAIGGVDQALWDLRGQAAGQPVWRLLGGERSSCPAYASGLLYESPFPLDELAVRAVEAGYRRIKMRIGHTWDIDLASLEAVRKAIGDEIDLMADGTQRFDLESALRMARELERHRVFWFEEPFEPEDLDAYAALRQSVHVPIATGENEFGFQGFREIIRAGAADIVQPDASRCGGISEVLRVAELAQREGLGFAPHSWCDPVAVIANAHVVAARPNGITVEIDQTGNRFIEGLLGAPLTVTDGLLELGDRPGLGVELDADFVRDHRLASASDVPLGNHCDLIFGPPSVLRPLGPYVGPPAGAPS